MNWHPCRGSSLCEHQQGSGMWLSTQREEFAKLMAIWGCFEGRIKVCIRAQQKISKLMRVSVSASMAQPPSRSAEWFPAMETRTPQGRRTGKQAHASAQVKCLDMGKEIQAAQEYQLNLQLVALWQAGVVLQKGTMMSRKPPGKWAVGRKALNRMQNCDYECYWCYTQYKRHLRHGPELSANYLMEKWSTAWQALYLYWSEVLRGVPDFGIGNIFLFL